MSPATATALERLAELAGRGGFTTEPGELEAYQIDGMRPAGVARPSSAEDTAEVVRFAARERLALIPAGGCTKLRIGATPRRYDLALNLSRLNRVLAYDPRDLTLGVEAGITFSDLGEVLASERQFLPLAPSFAERATIGGIVASNAGTPLRHAYGSARDYVLGMEFITGEGTASKSGGRVVKNVTGYDLHKLLIGSLGTLAVLTRINFRTFPLPPAQSVFVAGYPGAEEALTFCHVVARSPLEPRLVEVIEPRAARVLAGKLGGLRRELVEDGRWSVVVAAAGHERVVRRHAEELGRLAAQTKAPSFLTLSEQENSVVVGRIREFPALAMEASPAATIFRIGALPAAMAPLLRLARKAAESNQMPWATLVRAGGTIYFALLPPEKTLEWEHRLALAATGVFEAAAATGCTAMIEWCPAALKRRVNVWGGSRTDFPLMRRLKDVFDPKGILSPGRFVGGI